MFDRALVVRTWRFGSWLAGAMVIGALAVHLYIYLVGAVAGSTAAGGLKAAQVLLGPLSVLLIFFNTVLPIRFAKYLSAHGAHLAGEIRSVISLAVPVVGVYCILVSAFARPVLETVYGRDYRRYDVLVVLMAVYTFVSLFAFVFAAALSAMQRTRVIFYGNAAGTVVSVILGYPLVVWFGVTGAGIGMLIGLLLAVAVYGRVLRLEATAVAVPAH